jgi:hypothetical protein
MSSAGNRPTVVFSTDGQAPPLSFRREHLSSTIAVIVAALLALGFVAISVVTVIHEESFRANHDCRQALEADEPGRIVASGSRSVTCDYPTNAGVVRRSYSYELWPVAGVGLAAMVAAPIAVKLHRRRPA